jgi:S-adenosylmethionine synthetase
MVTTELILITKGITTETCVVITSLNEQLPEMAQGVDTSIDMKKW